MSKFPLNVTYPDPVPNALGAPASVLTCIIEYIQMFDDPSFLKVIDPLLIDPLEFPKSSTPVVEVLVPNDGVGSKTTTVRLSK